MSGAPYIMGRANRLMEHILRKPVESRRAYKQRRKAIVFGIILALGITVALVVLLAGCGGGSSTGASGGTTVTSPATPGAPLSAAEVQALVETAATAANDDRMVIAVVDRRGDVLAVYRKVSAGTTDIGNYGNPVDVNDLAVSLAGTAAYFSNDQAPLSSRTVRFISGIHFSPGVANTASAALYGIENTNRGCNLAASINAIVPPATTIAGASPGYGIITGKADLNDSEATAVNPGGVPIFKNGQEVGGIGVVAADPDTAEYVAFAAAGMIAMSGPSAATDGVGFPTFPAPGIVS